MTFQEDQIGQLSKKIADQEIEMTKLKEELDLHHHSPEKLSSEQMNEDDEKAYELLSLVISIIHLRLELHELENKKQRDKIELHSAKQSLEKCERILVSSL